MSENYDLEQICSTFTSNHALKALKPSKLILSDSEPVLVSDWKSAAHIMLDCLNRINHPELTAFLNKGVIQSPERKIKAKFILNEDCNCSDDNGILKLNLRSDCSDLLAVHFLAQAAAACGLQCSDIKVECQTNDTSCISENLNNKQTDGATEADIQNIKEEKIEKQPYNDKSALFAAVPQRDNRPLVHDVKPVQTEPGDSAMDIQWTRQKKLRQYFSDQLVFKENQKDNLKDLRLEPFLLDYIKDEIYRKEGMLSDEMIRQYIEKNLPDRKAWESIMARMMNGAPIALIARIEVKSDARSNNHGFALPDYGLQSKESTIDDRLWASCYPILTNKDKPVLWGRLYLEYRQPSAANKKGKVVMRYFEPIEPCRVDLNEYKKASQHFLYEEWIDVLLEAFGYNASEYHDMDAKLAMLSRLLVFVENNVNLIELAEQGIGKTFVFKEVSKYGTYISSKVTRARLFYDFSRKKLGAIFGCDFIALDEIQDETANDVDEMRKVLKEYLEYGTFSTDGFRNSSNAGVVLLGNIPSDEMKDNCNLFQYISNLFQEAAIFDRFHGMIEGNKIPRMHDNLKVNGLALNQEYFTSILHLLRDDNSFTGIFDEYVEIPEKADTRHTTAIRRLFTAWVKLLFPYIRLVRVDLNLLRKVLDIAVNMRRAVWSQLVMMDAGFADKPVGEYRIKER